MNKKTANLSPSEIKIPIYYDLGPSLIILYFEAALFMGWTSLTGGPSGTIY